MSIRWDPVLARHLAEELHSRLAGDVVRALRFDPDELDFLVLLRDHTLVWRLHPGRGQVQVRAPVSPGESDLRTGGRVRRVLADPDERIVRMEVLPRRSGKPLDIVIELMGNQWNALVVETPTGVVRHLLRTRASGRELRVGLPYRVPPPPGRRGVDGAVPLSDWIAILSPVPPERRRRELVRRFAWTSPLNAPHVLAEDQEASTEERLKRGYPRWVELARPSGPVRPVVLWLDRGPQPYPFPLTGPSHTETGDLLSAFTSHPADGDPGIDDGPRLIEPALAARFSGELERAQRLVATLRRNAADLEDPDRLRAEADLILARYGEIPRGSDEVVLTDFLGSPVHLKLDPRLPPHENASLRYEAASRAERAARRLPRLLDRARARLDELETLDRRMRAGTATAEEVRGALPERAPRRAGRSADGSSFLPYRRFWSSGGLEIRVGTGARANDDLTFHHSAPDDVWLHARHAAGAHVILRWGDAANPPARDLQEAATLAALHSKGRTSGSVPVDWTFRKYVRKPRRAPPGLVTMERARTVFAKPDPTLEGRLARRPGHADPAS